MRLVPGGRRSRSFRCGAAGLQITRSVVGIVRTHQTRITWDTKIVPDSCTCGAQLPPDARFCHKCGKPQRDEPLLVDEPVVVPPPPPLAPPPPAPPISFRNAIAVRVALATGIPIVLLSALLSAVS